METGIMILVILLLVAILVLFCTALILAFGHSSSKKVRNIYEEEYRKNCSTTNNLK